MFHEPSILVEGHLQRNISNAVLFEIFEKLLILQYFGEKFSLMFAVVDLLEGCTPLYVLVNRCTKEKHLFFPSLTITNVKEFKAARHVVALVYKDICTNCIIVLTKTQQGTL